MSELCLVPHPTLSDKSCQRKAKHICSHEANPDVIQSNDDGTDWSDWNHEESIHWGWPYLEWRAKW